MYQLGLLIFILSFSFFTVNIQADETIQVKNKHLSKNYPNELIGDVSVGKSLHYKVDASIIGFDHENTRVEVIASIDEKVPVQFPVSVTITQRDETSLILLPHSLKSDGTTLKYRTASKTLCVPRHESDDPERFIYIAVSSGSIQSIKFKIKILIQDDLQVIRNVWSNFTLTPSSRRHFYFPYLNDTSQNVVVKINSNNEDCMAAAIQEAKCPSFEVGDNLESGSSWEILSRSGAIRVDMRSYLKGFYVKLVVFKDDGLCGGMQATNFSLRQKTVSLTIEDDLALTFLSGHFWIVFTAPLALSILVAIFFGATYFICYSGRDKPCRAEDYAKGMSLRKLSQNDYPNSSNYGKWTFFVSVFFAIPITDQAIYSAMTSHKVGMYGSCNYNSLCSHSFWIFKDFNHVWSNICYVVLGIFFILFVLLKEAIYKRKIRNRNIRERKIRVRENQEEGVKFYTGLYYSMGLSLIIQGIINSIYHVCPSKSNFQYDLMYMSVVVSICLLKILEFRRPKSFSVESSIAMLVVCFIISSLGVTFERYFWDWNDSFFVFRICVGVIVGIFLFYIAIYMIYIGYPINIHPKEEQIPLQEMITDPEHRKEEARALSPEAELSRNHENERVMKYFGEIPRFCWIFPKVWHWKIPNCRPERFVFVLLMLSLNGYLIYFSLTINYCLYVFLFLVANLGLLLCFYLIMKLILGEFSCGSKSLSVFLFITLALLFGAGAVYFFLENLGEWTEPATHGRVGDEECLRYLPYQFYSKHDAWHILSAHTLFFVFMILLSMDDGVERVNWNYLMVF